MCGITAILNKTGIPSRNLVSSNMIVSHRGPDDEGYLLWRYGEAMRALSGQDTAHLTRRFLQLSEIRMDWTEWKVGLGHRRLSILDLSPSGHQPMILHSHGLAVIFNGEIFNYIEIRQDLQRLGHVFHTSSDTEVILHAWAEWEASALDRFNGMFAFILLDEKKGKMYAVRDRFGVKPLYFANTCDYLAFGSEAKQLRELPGYEFQLNEQIAYDYLGFGLIDHSEETFEKGIRQVMPGCLIEVDIQTEKWDIHRWYSLVPKTWKGSEGEAKERFYWLLKDSIRLRMRSDVPVGSALSGGLDSSTVVCLMRQILVDQGMSEHPIKTITSCQQDKRYDEWEYAASVVAATSADPYRIFPSFEKLREDFDRLLWHLDFPFGSTSQFSQWCVFQEAKRRGLTVMIDGQGADEQLAGYGGNDMALYSGLLRKGDVRNWFFEAVSYRKKNGVWPYGFLLGSVQSAFPAISKIAPSYYRPHVNGAPLWLKGNFDKPTLSGRSLQEHLIMQVQKLPLPALLRYEDRLSMAFSVESRIPFMDYRLIEFTLGLNENMIYREGERKYILRRAFRGLVPDKVLDRHDKMGFVSPEERWLKDDGRGWFADQIESAKEAAHRFLDAAEVGRHYAGVLDSRIPFSFEPWRVICFGKWLATKRENILH